MAIPKSVIALMWEYDPAALAALTDLPDAVIERVMERGRWAEMRWLLDAAGRERLSMFLQRRGGRTLPPRELRFWCWVTRVSEPQATAWVQQARQREALWRG
jgi:hypothetical protein